MSSDFRLGFAGISLGALLTAILLALPTPPEPRPSRPSLREIERERPEPTENAMAEGDEERQHEARDRWFKEMHRAPAGVDVQAIERDNGLAQTRRRTALRAAPPAPGAGTWVERGSNNQAGRMHIARESADGETLYAGSALGGLWKGTPEGTGWAPIGDNLYGGVHWLELVNGEDGAVDAIVVASDGGLVHRSTDGGATWEEPDGLGSLYWTRRLLKLRDGSEALFLVGTGTRSTKLYRSTDGGETFENIYDLGGYYGDLWAPRDGGTALYLAASDGVYKSDDLGDTWTWLSAFDSDAYQVELTGSEAGAPRLWAILGSRELVRSDDGGLSWTSLASITDYYGTLNASIQNADLFAYGGVDLYRTVDGGARFREVNDWSEYYNDPENLLHADMFGLDVELNPAGEELWYIGTDGGLYGSDDALASVKNLSLSGLRVSQYYGTLTSSAEPDHVAAGAQDQGYQLSNGVAQDDDLLELDQALSGDYGHLTSGDGTHGYVFSVYPGFILAQVGEDDPWLGYGDFPSRETYVPWLPPIVADPDDLTVFYFPATRLYKYTFSPRRGSFTSEQLSEAEFDGHSDEYVSALAFSPSDNQKMYASTSYGRFFTSVDKGITWTISDGTVPDDNWYYGQAILPSRFQDDTVYVGGGGYEGASVYRSDDGGATFTAWADGLPSTLVYCLCEAPDGSGRIFAGTETSVYMRAQDGAPWTDVTDNTAPITTYWSCESLTAENTIRFATYGRGIWDLRLARSGDGLDRDGADLDRPAGEGEGEGEGQPAKDGGRTCGCTSGGSTAPWGLLIAGLGLSRRRRAPAADRSATPAFP